MSHTWGCGPWENDTALDWLSRLASAHPPEIVLLEPLETVFNTPNDELMLFDCESALAAASLVAAHADAYVDEVPFEARRWVLGRSTEPSVEVLQLALRAVEKVLEESELRFNWELTAKFGDWYNEVDNLRTRIELFLAMHLTPNP